MGLPQAKVTERRFESIEAELEWRKRNRLTRSVRIHNVRGVLGLTADETLGEERKDRWIPMISIVAQSF